MKKRTVAFVLALAVSTSAMAQYRWVDKNGRVQYGDTPPAGAKATTLRPPQGPSTPSSGTKPALTPAEQEAEFRKRQQEAAKEREKQTQAADEAAARQESCDRAREALRTLESGQRVARSDASGERYFLNESQIAQETARARQSVQQSCS